MWHETKLERQVRQSGALPALVRVTSLIIIVGLLFFSLHIFRVRDGTSVCILASYIYDVFLFCLYERTNARTYGGT